MEEKGTGYLLWANNNALGRTSMRLYNGLLISKGVLWFILITEIVAIIIIYKLLLYMEKKAFEENKNVYNKISLLKENLKIWFWGNCIVLNIGLLIEISVILFCIYETVLPGIICVFLILVYSYRFVLDFILIFLTALILKVIKQDLPVYYYTSISLFFIILGLPLLIIISSGIVPVNVIASDFFNLDFIRRIYIFISLSLLGGGIVDLYRYIKNQKTGRFHYEREQ